MATPIRLMM